MLQNLRKRKSEEGFTIIEVLIVLAIAGLILLIVFLAVPALQRNSRNTQRKSDVSAMLSGVQEFTTDNNGTTPTGATYASSIITFTGAAGTSSVASAKLGYFKAAPTVIVLSSAGGSGSIPGSAPAVDSADIIIGAQCNNNTPAAGTARSVVAYYSVEQSGGSVGQCVESGS